MSLLIKNPSGENINIDLKPGDTIADIKVKILEKEGIPPGQQRLFCEETQTQSAHREQLENDRTVENCNFKNIYFTKFQIGILVVSIAAAALSKLLLMYTKSKMGV